MLCYISLDPIMECIFNVLILIRQGRKGARTLDSLVNTVLNGTGIDGTKIRTEDGWKKGVAGEDYPIHNIIPKTSFSCDAIMYSGFYGDPEADCQVFHRCLEDGNAGLAKHSFLCPNETVFHQKYLVCDWWHKVDCSTTSTREYYTMNERGSRSVIDGGLPSAECPERRKFWSRTIKSVIENVHSWQECSKHN